MPITQEQLSVTYFISHLRVADSSGSLRSCKNVPDVFVMDGMPPMQERLAVTSFKLVTV